MTKLYRRAERRVERLFPEDQAAREFCLADWPETREHLSWLIIAEAKELRDWVAAGQR